MPELYLAFRGCFPFVKLAVKTASCACFSFCAPFFFFFNKGDLRRPLYGKRLDSLSAKDPSVFGLASVDYHGFSHILFLFKIVHQSLLDCGLFALSLLFCLTRIILVAVQRRGTETYLDLRCLDENPTTLRLAAENYCLLAAQWNFSNTTAVIDKRHITRPLPFSIWRT